MLSLAPERLLPSVFPAYRNTGVVGYLLVTPALLAVTLLAAYIPSRRASRTDPTVALRYEWEGRGAFRRTKSAGESAKKVMSRDRSPKQGSCGMKRP